LNVLTYTSNTDQCAATFDDSFAYKVKDLSDAESSAATVNISGQAFNCIPKVDTNPFTQAVTGSQLIDFSPHISDVESADNLLKIELVTKPTKGVLSVAAGAADVNVEYGVNALTYTSNASECDALYADSFTYKVVDPSNKESQVSTANIAATAHNCMPVSSDFTKTITRTDVITDITITIDFSDHVSDFETKDPSL
jgi:hypothetical protein